jgi:hypothetical protein
VKNVSLNLDEKKYVPFELDENVFLNLDETQSFSVNITHIIKVTLSFRLKRFP